MCRAELTNCSTRLGIIEAAEYSPLSASVLRDIVSCKVVWPEISDVSVQHRDLLVVQRTVVPRNEILLLDAFPSPDLFFFLSGILIITSVIV